MRIYEREGGPLRGKVTFEGEGGPSRGKVAFEAKRGVLRVRKRREEADENGRTREDGIVLRFGAEGVSPGGVILGGG